MRRRRGAAGAAALFALAAGACAQPADLVLRGGLVIDGTGAPGERADVSIRDGHVEAIGAAGTLRGRRSLDVTGLVVAPGFVDLHSHADLILLADAATQTRLLEAKLRQGVTTLVVGNCGLGAAPADAETAKTLAGINAWMTPGGHATQPMTTRQYLDRLERHGVALNVATLVPHGPLRLSAMRRLGGRPSSNELETMRATLDDGIEAGALGVSVGLIYPPGMYADTAELIVLARVVAAHDGLFAAHVRGSSETLARATEELIEIARASRARVHHSHLEAVGRRFWPEIRAVLAAEDRARADGLALSHDVFPYTRAATMMSAIFPPWSLEGGVPALLARLRDPARRERIRRDIEELTPTWPPWQPGGWPHNLVHAVGWDGIRVASVARPIDEGLVGRSLAAIGASARRDPFDVAADLMLAQAGQVGQLVDDVSGQGEDVGLLAEILAHPAAAVVSDAEDYGRGVPHPAHAGAFARALRLARERSLVPLEVMVHKLTGRPAALAGLHDAGLLRPGAVADLVVFDSVHVADTATWEAPRRHASGVRYVILGGVLVLDDGRLGAPARGRVLRRLRSKPRA